MATPAQKSTPMGNKGPVGNSADLSNHPLANNSPSSWRNNLQRAIIPPYDIHPLWQVIRSKLIIRLQIFRPPLREQTSDRKSTLYTTSTHCGKSAPRTKPILVANHPSIGHPPSVASHPLVLKSTPRWKPSSTKSTYYGKSSPSLKY